MRRPAVAANGTRRRNAQGSLGEALVTRLIRVSGYSAIVFVVLIFLFLVREGLPALFQVPLAGTPSKGTSASCR